MKLTDDDVKIWKHVTKSVTPLEEGPSETQPKAEVVTFSEIVEKKLPPKKGKKRSYQACIDLHGMTQNDAHVHLAQTLARYKLKGYKCVLIITGKGGKYGRKQTGVLKRVVPLWLQTPKFRSLVRSTSPAKREDGGEGALYAYLK